MDVYRGVDKVAEFESYDELRVGVNKPAFIYEGNELVYPNPVKDGLVLWYDFSGRTNSDAQRDIAEDLSGNGNHGTLQNFNFTTESGYDKNKLLFDGVDDMVQSNFSGTNASNIHISYTANHLILDDSHHVVRVTLENSYFLMYRRGNGRLGIYNNDGASGTFPYYLEVNEVYHHSINIKDGNVEVFINGESLGDFNVEGLGNILSLGLSQGASPLKGSMFSTKIYNRPLTPEEIAHNYAIEKERFGIE